VKRLEKHCVNKAPEAYRSLSHRIFRLSSTKSANYYIVFELRSTRFVPQRNPPPLSRSVNDVTGPRIWYRLAWSSQRASVAIISINGTTRRRAIIYPQGATVFHPIRLQVQRAGFIKFIINLSRMAILYPGDASTLGTTPVPGRPPFSGNSISVSSRPEVLRKWLLSHFRTRKKSNERTMDAAREGKGEVTRWRDVRGGEWKVTLE